jgi:hypothetical protein
MYANAIREHLLQNQAEHAAMVLDALALAGYQSGDELSVGTAHLNFAGEGITMSAYALRKGLEQLRQLKLVASRVYNNRLRGAPVTIYRISPMNLIAEKLNVVIKAFDKITKAAVNSIRDYRAHLTRAFLARRPGTYSRDFLGERVGVSGRATYNYQKSFNDIEVKHRFHEQEITWDNLDLLPREKAQGPVFLRINVEVPLTEAEIAEKYAAVNPIWRPALHKTRIEERRFPALRAIAVTLLRDGHTVYMIRQLTNHYRVKGEIEMLLEERESREAPLKDEPSPEINVLINQNLDAIVFTGSFGTPAEVWSAAYNQMELQFDRQSFDTMMRDARLLDYEADTKTLVIKVANPYARDMLQHRLYRNVQRILRDVSGTELAARFEAKQTEDPLKRFLLRDSKNEVYPQ